MNKQQIQKQAKQILDKFAKALDKVKIDEKYSHFQRQDFERQENTTEKISKKGEFKKHLLENAPQKNQDFIIAEKGDWK